MKIKMNDGSIQEAGFEEELGKNAFRHTTAHILAQAVKRLYPTTKCAIGPSIAEGFYYDFDFDFRFSEENFAEIEAEMKKIVKENLQLRHFTADRRKAEQLMEERDETYKLEILKDLPEDETISFYQQGEYLEMCAGPMRHIPVRSGHLSCCPLRVHTGAAMKRIKCLPGFTAHLFRTRVCWRNI